MGWSEIQKPEDKLPLYPDIEKHGSLANLLNDLFSKMGSPLRCEDSPLFKQAGGHIRYGKRYSQLSIAARTRSFHFDLWQQGVCLTSWSENPQDMALVLHRLLVLNQSQLDVEAEVSWFNLDIKARTFLEGTKAYTDNQWRQLDEWMREDTYLQQLHPVLVAARAHPQLGLLYPFTSLCSLQFSRCTGYPFDCPCSGIWATPKTAPNAYQVQGWGSSNKTPEFKGNVEQVIAFVAAQLPPNCGPARQGTADDM